VRLADVTYPFEMAVARPDPNGADPAEVKAVDDALDAIVAKAGKPLKLRVVDPGAAADVRLAVTSDQAVARLAGGAQSASRDDRRPPAMAIARSVDGKDDFTQKLQDTLVTMFRATGLSRLTAASTFGPKDFVLQFGQQAAGSDTIAPMAIEETPVIRPNDRLFVDFTNQSGKAVDLNLLFVDHDYGIALLCAAHLAAGDRLFRPFADIEASDKGSERVIAVVNESGKELTDLSFLAQPGLSGLRDVSQPGLLGMLGDLGAGQPTRAAPVSMRDPKVPRGAVVMLPLEAQAATGAAAAADTPVKDDREQQGDCGA
jgi:hypothetical protein